MPALISVEEFVKETKDDFSSPITSSFASRMPQCKQTVIVAEEALDDDKGVLVKLKKTLKALAASGTSHIKNEELLCDYLEELGGRESQREPESTVGPPMQKFAVLTRNMSSLFKTLLQHMTHNVCFPIDNLLKGDLRDVRGDVRRPFDRACKEYEAKYTKLEKEKKAQAKEAGLIRSEVTPAELADELDKERKLFQLHMCEYLIRVNEIKTKKGVDLLEHLIAYYNAQVNYFEDGIKTLEQFRSFVQDLSGKLQKIRQKQDEERKQLVEIRNLIKSSPGLEVQNQSGVYHLHPVHNQANKSYGAMISGHLLKKSEGKVRKVWQRRRCEVRDGVLTIYHADESKVPTEVNLLTCHIKHVPEEKRCFDLISHNRTYHFQTEDDKDHERWISVLMNSKDGALQKAFDDNGRIGPKVNHSLVELQQAIIRFVKGLPGNDRCADCLSENDATWLSTNFGIIVCIECSGVHREMGVHVSRIQSLTLDHVAPSQLLVSYNMSNRAFNEVFEATRHTPKPPPESSMHSMEIRSEFIRAKYIEKRFTIRTCSDTNDLENDVRSAIINGDLHQLLQAYAEGADFCQPFQCQDDENGETPLHFGARLGTSLPVFDFIVENSKNLDVRTADGLTPLHYCAMYDQPEHMKLLIRSGANVKAESNDRKTASHLAVESSNRDCKLLLDKLTGVKPYDTLTPSDKKLLLDNVVFHWNLSQDDGSTDFSEDETIVDTPVNENETTPVLRTRQNIYDRISPRARSRSSTSESLPGSSPPAQLLRPDFGTVSAPSSNIKKTTDRQKRAAPNPPPTQLNRASELYPLNTSSSTPHIGGHQRNQSDVGLHSLRTFGLKSPGTDILRTKSTSAMSHSNLMTQSLYQPAISGGTLVLPRGDPPPLKPVNYLNLERPNEKPMTIPRPASLMKNNDLQRSFSAVDNQSYHYQSIGGGADPGRGAVVVVNTNPGVLNTGSLQRPKNPPPPTPVLSQRVNGKEVAIVPPERRNIDVDVRPKRCRALYDCEADNDDELSFEEGNIIIITSEKTEDENWMEGYLESSPSKKGVFPASFVTLLSR